MVLEIAKSEETTEQLMDAAKTDIKTDDGSASGLFKNKRRKVIPLGRRLLVRRRKVGKRDGMIQLPNVVEDKDTDIADVIFTPERTFVDVKLLENAENYVNVLHEEVIGGSADALNALRWFNDYLYEMSIQPGDTVIINKYRGTDFTTTNTGENHLSVVACEDVIAVIKEVE